MLKPEISLREAISNVNGNLLEAALVYARRGIPVFPLQPGKKIPLSGSHGFKDATLDEKTIWQWWSKNPNHNIGIPTGPASGWLVLDEDLPEGPTSLAALEHEHGPLPKTLKQRTGSGGHQYIFRYPAGSDIRNSAGDLGTDIDLRGNGGYIAAPPSIHPNRQTYQWLNDLEPALSPDWLIKRATAKNSNAPQKSVNAKPADLSLVFDGVDDGQRDDLIFKFARSRLARGISVAEIEHLVVEAARKCNPPFPEHEALAKVRSALKYANAGDHPSDELLSEAKQSALSILPRIKSEPALAVTPETIGVLALVEKHDPETWVTVKKELTKHRLLKDVERAMRKQRLHVVDSSESPLSVGEILVSLGIDPPTITEKLFLPAPYIFDKEGVGSLINKTDGPERRDIAPTWTLIVKRLQDVSSHEESLELTFYEAHRWHYITVPRGQAVNSRTVVQLADYGYPVHSGNSQIMAGFHHDFLFANVASLPVEQVSGQFGWLRDGDAFLWGQQALSAENVRVKFYAPDTGERQIAQSLRSAGSFDDWQKAVAPLVDYPVAQVGIYASFAAPLIKVLKTGNIGVDLCRRTSTGKTTILRIAASVWGRPDEDGSGGFMRSWDSTSVAAERRAARLNDLPCIRDDTKRAKPKSLEALVYNIINGIGRDRGSKTGLAEGTAWRTVLISSGEAALTSYCESDGAKARILEIRSMPFGADNEVTRKVVDRLNIAVTQYCGHAGPHFVKWLIRSRNQWPEFQQRFRAKAAQYLTQVSGAASRLADAAAVIALAGELAHEAGCLPWQFSDPFLSGLWADIQRDIDGIDAPVRALRDIFGWACANQASFFGHHEQDKTPREWFGRWDSEAWLTIDILPQVLKATLESFRHSYEGTIHEWRERNWLDTAKDHYTKRVYLGKDRVRMVCIKKSAIEAADREESLPTPPSKQNVTSVTASVEIEKIRGCWPECPECEENQSGHCALSNQRTEHLERCPMESP